jgi:hypothetical protein
MLNVKVVRLKERLVVDALVGREITVKDLFCKKIIYGGVGGFARMGGYGVLGA